MMTIVLRYEGRHMVTARLEDGLNATVSLWVGKASQRKLEVSWKPY